MPQMAPYNWLMLFLLFNLIMTFIITFNHFSMFNSNKNPQINLITKKKFNWSW